MAYMHCGRKHLHWCTSFTSSEWLIGWLRAWQINRIKINGEILLLYYFMFMNQWINTTANLSINTRYSGGFRGGGPGPPPGGTYPTSGVILRPRAIFRFLPFLGGWMGAKKLFPAPNWGHRVQIRGQNHDQWGGQMGVWGLKPPFIGFGSPPRKILDPPLR